MKLEEWVGAVFCGLLFAGILFPMFCELLGDCLADLKAALRRWKE